MDGVLHRRFPAPYLALDIVYNAWLSGVCSTHTQALAIALTGRNGRARRSWHNACFAEAVRPRSERILLLSCADHVGYREAFKYEVEGFVNAATTPEAISCISLFLSSRDIKKRALSYGLPADPNPYTSRPIKQVSIGQCPDCFVGLEHG